LKFGNIFRIDKRKILAITPVVWGGMVVCVKFVPFPTKAHLPFQFCMTFAKEIKYF
jgi:hypothetical protein